MPQNAQTIIFSNKLTAIEAKATLKAYGAENVATKRHWLVKESSVTGLLVVCYYNFEKDKFVLERLAFRNGNWCEAPTGRNDATIFAQSVDKVSRDNLPENVMQLLEDYLRTYQFDFNNIIHPAPEQASENSQYANLVDVVNSAQVNNP